MSSAQWPAPGWYQDPGTTGMQRYWNGAAWEEPRPDPGAPIIQPPLSAGVSTSTWSIWILALLPLVGIATTIELNLPHLISSSLREAHEALQHPGTVVVPAYSAGYWISQATGALLGLVTVLLGVHDWRTLKRIGIVRPFSWGWIFLQPTYIIGRSIVVHRRTGKGFAPLWAYTATYLVTLAVDAILFIPALAAIRG